MSGGKPWPQLSDIRIRSELIGPYLGPLSSDAFRALTLLVDACATSMVWTYTAPMDGSLADDDEILARIAFQSVRKWRRVRPDLEQFFRIANGRWHLVPDWIEIDTGRLRGTIPASVHQIVLRREGEKCTYCGDTDGPFDLDHILPISRGGLDDASNLTIACAACNRSKGGRTLREWMEGKR